VTTRSRAFVGGTVLAAGLCSLLAPSAPTATAAAPPALPKESYQRASKAEIAFLQQKLDDIVADPMKNRGAVRTVKASAMMLSVYADALKDDALKSSALKVASVVEQKDFKGAAEAAKGLSSPKADPSAKPPKSFVLEDVMSPFRVAKAGGQNVEADIKSALKNGKIEAESAELIGVRSAVIADFATGMPNDKASANNAMKMKWERWSKDMSAASKELTEEAAKGKGADEKKMLATLKKLDAACINCHNDFRNEP
jgi:hypothetical protein